MSKNIVMNYLNSDGSYEELYPGTRIENVNNLQATLDLFQSTLNALESNLNSIDESLSGKLNVSGGTMTGDLILNRNPVSDLMAATKGYVDGLISSTVTETSKIQVIGMNGNTLYITVNYEPSFIFCTIINTRHPDSLIPGFMIGFNNVGYCVEYLSGGTAGYHTDITTGSYTYRTDIKRLEIKRFGFIQPTGSGDVIQYDFFFIK